MQYKIKEMPLEELEPKVVEGLLEHKERLGYNIPKKDTEYIGFAALSEVGKWLEESQRKSAMENYMCLFFLLIQAHKDRAWGQN